MDTDVVTRDHKLKGYGFKTLQTWSSSPLNYAYPKGSWLVQKNIAPLVSRQSPRNRLEDLGGNGWVAQGGPGGEQQTGRLERSLRSSRELEPPEDPKKQQKNLGKLRQCPPGMEGKVPVAVLRSHQLKKLQASQQSLQ
ncbi:hypothetical protein QTO34_017784 [Cnephaeus nilssonii]|uniref:Uncharacterized protein n=1 Tax=Cnephaeus nilssonii TaxID=3371016 RepID=A0AA40I1N2_CNENI|nr:hypothetical protein QTO34_017784 [Eptesicus nilssonii]